jgi:glycosyltransferase involved in cell wall biosynthesis
MKILLIIPAYNEEKNILGVCKNIEKYNNDKEKKLKIDYVVINDGSVDNTSKICKDNNLNHIDLISNLGIGGAVQAGYKYANQNGYDIAIQFDGDGQHDVSYVESICKPIINEKFDMCIGSRYLDSSSSEFKSTFMRRFGKNIISFIIKTFCNVRVTDPTSGFRAVNKNVIKIFSNDYPSDYPEPESIVNLIKSGLNITEVAVSMNERKGGKSSINLFKSIYYMIKVSIAIVIESLKSRKVSGGI